MKAILHKLKYNHLYARIEALQQELGTPRIQWDDTQLDFFKAEFAKREAAGRKKDLRNIEILYLTGKKFSIPFSRND